MEPIFLPQEFELRRQAVLQALAESACDGLLCGQAESIFWLCGAAPDEDEGPVALLLDADGGATLLSDCETGHAAELPVGDRRPWARDAHGAIQLAAVIHERGLHGARIGIDGPAACAGGCGALRLDALPADVAHWQDATGLVARLQTVKSAREMAFIRRAAGLADDAFEAALARIGPGAWEGELLAAMQGAVLQGGGTHAADGWRIASGGPDGVAPERSVRRRLEAGDRLELQWAGAYRHYRAPMSRTLTVGEDLTRAQRGLYSVALDAMAAACEACAPGRLGGDVFAAYAGVLEQAGLRPSRHCGYGLGLQLRSGMMGAPVLERDQPLPLDAGMALFVRTDVVARHGARRVRLGQSVEVTEAGAVSLHRHDLGDPA